MSFGITGVVFTAPVVATAIAITTDASPIQYGIVGLILIFGLVPIIKWMMNRMDIYQRNETQIISNMEVRLESIAKILEENAARLNTVISDLEQIKNKQK